MSRNSVADSEFISVGSVSTLVDEFYDSIRSSDGNVVNSIVPPPVLYRDSVIASNSVDRSEPVDKLDADNLSVDNDVPDCKAVAASSSPSCARKFHLLLFSFSYSHLFL